MGGSFALRLRRFAARILTFRSGDVLIYAYGQSPGAPDLPCPAEILQVDQSHLADVLSMEAPSTVARFRDFLAAGDAGYYAYQQGRVVHRSWVQFGPRRVMTWYDQMPLQLGPREAYIHFCETWPAARGQGIYPAVLRRIANDLLAGGIGDRQPIVRILIATEAGNRASRRGIEKAGFVAMKRLRAIVLFGLSFERAMEPASES